jgi:hypothetical protein
MTMGPCQSMIRKADSIRGGNRFSEKIMLHKRASKRTQSEEVSLERPSQWVSVAVGGSIGALRPISCLNGYASDQIALGFLEKKSQMVRRDFSRAVPETFAMVGWSTGRQMVAVDADPETLPDGRWSDAERRRQLRAAGKSARFLGGPSA